MELPEPIASALAGRRTDGRNRAMSSPATVLRYTGTDGADLFLKVQVHDEGAAEPGLEPERGLLSWLDGRLGAPQVMAFHEEAGTQYLLTTSVPGRSASSGFDEQEKPHLVHLLAQGLRRIHAHPAGGCPGDGRALSLIARAEGRLRRGGLPEEAHRDMLQRLRSLRDVELPPEDLVLTHGDYCLPNIMVAAGRLSGVLDLGYAGVGDPYRDFVAADDSVRRNLGEAWVPLFFEEYGVEPDPEKMEVHRLLYGLW